MKLPGIRGRAFARRHEVLDEVVNALDARITAIQAGPAPLTARDEALITGLCEAVGIVRRLDERWTRAARTEATDAR